MGRSLIFILFLIPAVLMAQVDEFGDPVGKPLTKQDQRAIMGIASLFASIPLLFLATHVKYDQGQGAFIGAGSLCLVHGSICLIKF